MADLTFDLWDGTCSSSADAGNFWFKVESHGSYIKRSLTWNGATSDLALFRFDGED